MWGFWDIDNEIFARHYELWYDEDAVEKLLALDEETWLAGGPEVEAIENAAEEKAGLQLYAYDTELEAQEEFQSWNSYDNYHYCVKEIPTDEPEWILF